MRMCGCTPLSLRSLNLSALNAWVSGREGTAWSGNDTDIESCAVLLAAGPMVVLQAGLRQTLASDWQSTFAVHGHRPAAQAVTVQSSQLLLLLLTLLFVLQLALQLFKCIQRGSHPLLLGRLLGCCHLLDRMLQQQPARQPAKQPVSQASNPVFTDGRLLYGVQRKWATAAIATSSGMCSCVQSSSHWQHGQ
jgi:hypothetical protein